MTTPPFSIPALREAARPFFDRGDWLGAWLERRRLAEIERACALAGPMVETIEHIPAEPVIVSAERQRELRAREWTGPTQTNRLTGAVGHLRRRWCADGFVTEWVEGPA